MSEKEFIQTPLQRILEILVAAKNQNLKSLPLDNIINLVIMSEHSEKQLYVDAFIAGRVHEFYSETLYITDEDCDIFDEDIAEEYFFNKYGVEEPSCEIEK